MLVSTEIPKKFHHVQVWHKWRISAWLVNNKMNNEQAKFSNWLIINLFIRHHTSIFIIADNCWLLNRKLAQAMHTTKSSKRRGGRHLFTRERKDVTKISHFVTAITSLTTNGNLINNLFLSASSIKDWHSARSSVWLFLYLYLPFVR